MGADTCITASALRHCRYGCRYMSNSVSNASLQIRVQIHVQQLLDCVIADTGAETCKTASG
ncbi:hypothetical protein DPMN_150527 [Dreissena polymorpha]|uniref:Uncharacterized protein n=1 Tax=Dreissena polymorpha TaxID=45954 RepID=A0A9D4FFJ1_DREPO|nr:hypothetical protein DPMN_150527 [Dreissena polymorpha]